METKHTKGEWSVKEEGRFLLILSDNENQIADVTVPLDLEDMDFREECEANAKLIASAPMLLEALQKVKSELMYENLINKQKSSGRNWQVELDIINQAIIKATE